MSDDIVSSFLKVDILKPENFLKIKETLTRIGIPSYKDGNVLWQTCHILQKRGSFYIVHFKELFLLDNKSKTDFTAEDIQRRNAVAQLLEQWGLVKIETSGLLPGNTTSSLKVLSYNESKSWKKQAKYTMASDSSRART